MFFLWLLNLLQVFFRVISRDRLNILKIIGIELFVLRISTPADCTASRPLFYANLSISYELSTFPSSFTLSIIFFWWISCPGLHSIQAIHAVSISNHVFSPFIFLFYRNSSNQHHSIFYIIQIFIGESNFLLKYSSFHFKKLLP